MSPENVSRSRFGAAPDVFTVTAPENVLHVTRAAASCRSAIPEKVLIDCFPDTPRTCTSLLNTSTSRVVPRGTWMSNSVLTTLLFFPVQLAVLLVGVDRHGRAGRLDVELDVVEAIPRGRADGVDRHFADVGSDDADGAREVVQGEGSAGAEGDDLVNPLGLVGHREGRERQTSSAAIQVRRRDLHRQRSFRCWHRRNAVAEGCQGVGGAGSPKRCAKARRSVARRRPASAHSGFGACNCMVPV